MDNLFLGDKNMSILSYSMEENINLFKEIFNNDPTLIMREFKIQNNPNYRFLILYLDNMVDPNTIAGNIIKPIVYLDQDVEIRNIDFLKKQVIISAEVKSSRNLVDITNFILRGDTLLLMDESSEGLIIDTKGFKTRGIEEPELEKSIKGPREGFTESLGDNITLLRRKLETKDLKFQHKTIGTSSRTRACITYLGDRIDKEILEEVNRRIDAIQIDGVLSVKSIHELIDDESFSIFEMAGETEKPDILASKLLEGRIGILLDRTPNAITIPHLFIENFQTSEDYYTNYFSGTIMRLLRIFGFWLTISFPALYLTLVTYHKAVIPGPLLLSIYGSRQGVPFPTIVELTGLFIVFEILIEAGSRTPSYIGQALGIVGALVLGSTAVEARIVSSTMIIVVGISSISALMLPSMKSQILMIRAFLLFSSTIFGIYGYTLAMSALLIHLFSLRSYGVLYMSTMNSLYGKDLKDTYFRGPRWYIENKKLGDKK